MANYDGTGPMGMGSGTGRQQGPCYGYTPQKGARRGFGRGLRFGRGCRCQCPCCGYYGPSVVLTKDDQKKLLEDEVKVLEEELKDAKTALEEVEKTE